MLWCGLARTALRCTSGSKPLGEAILSKLLLPFDCLYGGVSRYHWLLLTLAMPQKGS